MESLYRTVTGILLVICKVNEVGTQLVESFLGANGYIDLAQRLEKIDVFPTISFGDRVEALANMTSPTLKELQDQVRIKAQKLFFSLMDYVWKARTCPETRRAG